MTRYRYRSHETSTNQVDSQGAMGAYRGTLSMVAWYDREASREIACLFAILLPVDPSRTDLYIV